MFLSQQVKMSVLALSLFLGLVFYHSASQANEVRSIKQTSVASTTLKSKVQEEKSFSLKHRNWTPVRGLKNAGGGSGPYAAACGSSSSVAAALDQCGKNGFVFASCKKYEGNWTCEGTQRKKE